MLQVAVVVQQEDGRVRQVVHVQELAQRGPGAPADDLLEPVALGLVEAPDERGEDVGVGGVEVVVGAVQVGGHACAAERVWLVSGLLTAWADQSAFGRFRCKVSQMTSLPW